MPLPPTSPGLLDYALTRAREMTLEITFSHTELSLVMFALEEGRPANVPQDPCQEAAEACPIVEQLEDTFGWRNMSPQERLCRRLGKHLRQSWVDCGLLDLREGATDPAAADDITRMRKQLAGWSCQVTLDSVDRDLLNRAIAKLPRSAWISMPRTMWRLRRKLRQSRARS